MEAPFMKKKELDPTVNAFSPSHFTSTNDYNNSSINNKSSKMSIDSIDVMRKNKFDYSDSSSGTGLTSLDSSSLKDFAYDEINRTNTSNMRSSHSSSSFNSYNNYEDYTNFPPANNMRSLGSSSSLSSYNGSSSVVSSTADVKYYTNLMNNTCASNGNWKEAENILAIMQKKFCYPNVFTFNVLIKTYKSAGMRKKAESQLDLMRQDGVEPDIVSYNTVLDAYCSAGLIEDAQRVLNDNTAYLIPNKRTYSILLKGYARANPVQPSRALDLLLHMQNSGVTPDVVVLNTVCDVCCSVGKVEEAINVLRQFPKIPPNIKTYSILLKGYTRMAVPQPDKVLELLKYMELEGCNPDIVTYNTVLKSLSDANRVNDSILLLRKIKTSNTTFPDKNTYTIIMLLFCKAGMFREAAEIIFEASSNGYTFDLVSFTPFFSSCKSEDELQKILYIINFILPYANIVPTSELMHTILKAVEIVSFAKAVINCFDSKGVSITTTSLNILLQLYVRNGDALGAYSLIMKFIQSVRISNEQPKLLNINSYGIVIEGLCSANNSKAPSPKSEEDSSSTSQSLIKKKCYPEEACNLLQLLFQASFIPTIELCNLVLVTCYNLDFNSGVNRIFLLIKDWNGRNRVNFNEVSIDIFIRSKIKSLCNETSASSLTSSPRKLFNMDVLEHEIFETVRSIIVDYSVFRMHEVVIGMLCEFGQFYLAYELFNTKLYSKELLPTISLYQKLFKGWGLIGNDEPVSLDVIMNLLSHMEKSGTGIADVETFNIIITSLCNKKFVVEACNILNSRMKTSSREISRHYPNKVTYETIIKQCIKMAKEDVIHGEGSGENSPTILNQSSLVLIAQEMIQEMINAGLVPSYELIEAVRMKNYRFMSRPIFEPMEGDLTKIDEESLLMELLSTGLAPASSDGYSKKNTSSVETREIPLFQSLDLFGLRLDETKKENS